VEGIGRLGIFALLQKIPAGLVIRLGRIIECLVFLRPGAPHGAD